MGWYSWRIRKPRRSLSLTVGLLRIQAKSGNSSLRKYRWTSVSWAVWVHSVDFFILCYVFYCFLVPWFTCGQDYHWTGIYHWSLSEDEGKLPAAFMKVLWLVITCFFMHFLFSAIHRKAAEDTVSDFVSVHKRDQVYRCEVKGMIIFHSEAYVAFPRTWSEGSQIDEMVKNKKLGMKCVMSSQLSSLCEIICDLLP